MSKILVSAKEFLQRVLICACGGAVALQACVEESIEMVEEAWEKMDELLPDSFYKVVLRAFSWYLLERHY